MKFCPYCGLAHERKARACCVEHGRKLGGKTAAVTTARRRAVRAIMVAAQDELRHRTKWRQIALGVNEGPNLQRIFGLDLPAPMQRR